jgi:uncharacterized protein (TIGR02594 family)
MLKHTTLNSQRGSNIIMTGWAGGFSRFWNIHEFEVMEGYLRTLKFDSWRPKFVVLHNTGSPSLARWKETDELQRIKNLEHFYRDIQAWSSGPHFFVSPTRIFEGTPFNVPGTHSPSWNNLSIGIEMAGDYETEIFDLSVRSNTVKLLSIIHKVLGLHPDEYKLGVRGLHFHKEDPKTTHRTCPGKNVVKSVLVKDVLQAMSPQMKEQHLGAVSAALAAPEDAVFPGGHINTAVTEAPKSPSPVTTPRSSFADMLGDKVLRTGSQNYLVKSLQVILRDYGYPLKGTGYFGPATDTAVRDFQVKANLAVDGEVGTVTAKVLSEGQVASSPKEVILPEVPGLVTPTPILVSDQPMWLIEGLKWINTKEVPGDGDNPVILEWAKEEGGKIAETYKHDSTAWCALWAGMILNKVGLPGTGTLWALDFLTTKSLVTLPGPAVGAFAPMRREGGGHIAVIVGRNGDHLMCLGGNQNNEVSIAAFPKDRPLAFRWPKGVTLPVKIGFDTLPIVRSDGTTSATEA